MVLFFTLLDVSVRSPALSSALSVVSVPRLEILHWAFRRLLSALSN